MTYTGLRYAGSKVVSYSGLGVNGRGFEKVRILIEVIQMEEKKRGRPRKKVEEVPEQPKKSRKKTGIGKSGNLIPTSVMTDEEKSEFGRKGGYASAIARRKKKELRAFTKDFLMQDAASVLKQNMKMLGVEDDDMTNLAAVVIRLFSKAVNQGDLNAARTLIEWAGMAPLQQEKENEAIARMAQVMQLAGTGEQENTDEADVVFYIPANGRPVYKDDEIVTVGKG